MQCEQSASCSHESSLIQQIDGDGFHFRGESAPALPTSICLEASRSYYVLLTLHYSQPLFANKDNFSRRKKKFVCFCYEEDSM